MLANSQLLPSTSEKDFTTFVAIPVDSLKNPNEHNNLKVIQNVVIQQLPDGTICLADAPEDKEGFVSETNHTTETVPLKLVNDATTDKLTVKNRTILLHPPTRKQSLRKLEPKLPAPPQYKCIKCDNTYDTVSQYNNHMRWHKCQKRFKCDKCALGYNVENNLKIHAVLMHSEAQNSMECPICHVTLTFQRVASLRSHLMLHQVEELYTCDECDAEFDIEDDFMKHLGIHVAKKRDESKPLTCSHCKLEFKEAKEFRTHIADHVKLRKTFMKNRRPRKPGGKKEESNYVCSICKKGFIKNSLLERHLRIHSGEKPFKCTFCDRSFTQKGTLQIHLSRHSGIKPFACTLCPARFNQKGNLVVHVRKTHTFPPEENQEMYKCSQCSCIFKKIATLNGHVTKAHLNTRDSSKLDDNLIEDVMSKLKELEKQTSGHTNTERNKENEPKEHVVIENKPVPVPEFDKKNFINLTESRNDGTVKRYWVRQKKVGDVRWYFCNYCSKQFKKPSDLIRHMRVHTKEKPFKCLQCNAEFTLKSTLICHVRTHTNKLNYSCKICNSSFISLRVLNAHLRKHDFESLPKWQCLTCGFLFDDLDQGVKHREQTVGDKPHVVQPFINHIMKQPLYQTAYGSLAFKPPKTKFPNTGFESPTLRPFHCTQCDARFTRRINLKRHIQFHNGDRNFKCHLCPKTFISSYRLKEHLNFHNNVKNYACRQCDKRFVTATLLKRHVIIHNNHKPYQCPYCSKTFKTLLLCRTHITKVHKKEVVSKLNLESESLLTCNESNSDQGADLAMTAGTENVVLQDLPPASASDNVVIEQLLPDEANCIQIMNPEGALTDVGYPTIYVNMNDLQFLDTSNLNLNSSEQLKLQEPDPSLITQPETMQVNDIIFNIDSLKTGLSLPPEEIFDTSVENQAPLPSIAEITKPIKLNGFADLDKATENLSSVLNNNTSLFGSDTFNNYLNLPIATETGDGSTYDSTTSAAVFQASTTHTDDLYENTNIICISCSLLFINLEQFQKHNCNVTEQDPSAGTSENAHRCNVCNKLFTQRSSLDRHLNTHSVKNITCSICKAVLHDRNQYSKHLATHRGPKGGLVRSCKFCFKEFKKPSDLNRHLRTHTGEKPFRCDVCSKTFSLKSTLESHVKTHDQSPKQYSCNVCNSFFSSKSSLKVHMTLHTGHKPHTCAFCEQKFRTVGNKKSHEALMHLAKPKKTGESKQTRVKNILESVASGIISNLNEIQPNQNSLDDTAKTEIPAEVINVPPPTEENLLSLLQDDQNAMDPVLLLQQLQMSGLILTNENNEPVSTLLLDDGIILNVNGGVKDNTELATVVTNTHDNYTAKSEKVRNLECDICHKMYASKDVLRKHRKNVHGVNKKYPCIKCDRAFDTQDELSKHNKWHTGYRAFSCVYCANSFTEEYGLKSHMKRMHQHSNATKTTTSALLDVNFDIPTESIDDPLLNNLFTFKKIV